MIDAVRTLAAAGKSVTRSAVRDAIQDTSLKDSLIGPVQFNSDGDLKKMVISVFQIVKDTSAPLDDPDKQYKYVGVAPMS